MTTPVNKAKKFIDGHYTKIKSMGEIAKYTGVSREYLSRSFRNEFGISIKTYLDRVRTKHAQHLLRFTDMKCYQIARTVGLHDELSLNKLFRRLTGQSPRDYRSRNGRLLR